jgi:RNA polymerase sigma factor (sigma-70 family)
MNTSIIYDSTKSRKERFDQVYAKLHQALFTNIFNIVQNRSTAEDLLQDVFVSFWEKMDDLDTENPANWLFVVSFNKSLSLLKKNHKIQPEELCNTPDLQDAPTEDMEQEFAEKLGLVYEAIQQLPDRKQVIFKKHRLEGEPLDQIAFELELSIHTVKDHLKVANRMIRQYVAETKTIKIVPDLAIYLILWIAA